MDEIMKFRLLVTITICSSFFYCRRQNEKLYEAEKKLSSISTDTTELRKWVNVPHALTSASWEIIRVGNGEMGPSDLIFIGRLDFLEEDVDQLLLKRDTLTDCRIDDSLLVNWKNYDLIKYFSSPEDSTAGFVVPNRKCYDPKAFLNKSFSDGFYIILDNKRSVFLYLATI
jgi:hypothetical protein